MTFFFLGSPQTKFWIVVFWLGYEEKNLNWGHWIKSSGIWTTSLYYWNNYWIWWGDVVGDSPFQPFFFTRMIHCKHTVFAFWLLRTARLFHYSLLAHTSDFLTFASVRLYTAVERKITWIIFKRPPTVFTFRIWRALISPFEGSTVLQSSRPAHRGACEL